MAGTTPKYAWSYPTGTDRVMDGDNAIEALARAVETTVGSNRVWYARRSADGTVVNNTNTVVVSLPFTGAPVGSQIAVYGVVNIGGASAIFNVTTFWTPTSLTGLGNDSKPVFSGIAASVYVIVPIIWAVTTTAANAQLDLTVNATAGTPNCTAQTNVLGVRIS